MNTTTNVVGQLPVSAPRTRSALSTERGLGLGLAAAALPQDHQGLGQGPVSWGTRMS